MDKKGWSFKARLMEEDEKRDGGPTQTGMVQSVLTPALETDSRLHPGTERPAGRAK